jgi:hypothetical protein
LISEPELNWIEGFAEGPGENPEMPGENPEMPGENPEVPAGNRTELNRTEEQEKEHVAPSENSSRLVRPDVPTEKAAPKTGAGSRKKRSTEEIKQALGEERLPWWTSFWGVYPCHDGMNRAMDAFERKAKARETAVAMYRGAERYRAKAQSDATLKLKYAEGWINDERWKDEELPLERVGPVSVRKLGFEEKVTKVFGERIARGEDPWTFGK